MLEGLILPEGHAVRVTVPASTSNLGPGFDALGLALNLRLEVSIRGPAEAHVVEVSGPAEAEWPARDDLLLCAFDRVRQAFGGTASGKLFHVRSEIPIGRGLGSSGAAVTAGLLLGAALAPRDVTRADLMSLGLAIEGHPDNVAAALFGGCVIAVPRIGSTARIVHLELHESLAFCLAWPATQLSTSVARELLPKQVPFADATHNPRQLALLIEGLRSGDPELLAFGAEDRLHVKYRLPHIPGGAAALDAAREAGAFCATISGSGTALFAISDPGSAAAVAGVMESELRRADGQAWSRVVSAVVDAPVPLLEH